MQLTPGLFLLSAMAVVAHSFLEDLTPHIIGEDHDGTLCGSKLFTCRSIMKCLPKIERCDGKDDCGDNSDEDNCKETPHQDSAHTVQKRAGACGSTRFTCMSVMKCVAFSQVCDGTDNCGDNSDEKNCL